jgi:hypothetical protein
MTLLIPWRSAVRPDRPPNRRGHYAHEGTVWHHEDGGSYPVLGEADSLEIELEELVGGSLPERVLRALRSFTGLRHYRFVGRAVSADPRWPRYVVPGPSFSSPTAFWSAESAPKLAWAPDMVPCLDELRTELAETGWLQAGHGEHPWSYRYTRPWIDRTAPLDD